MGWWYQMMLSCMLIATPCLIWIKLQIRNHWQLKVTSWVKNSFAIRFSSFLTYVSFTCKRETCTNCDKCISIFFRLRKLNDKHKYSYSTFQSLCMSSPSNIVPKYFILLSSASLLPVVLSDFGVGVLTPEICKQPQVDSLDFNWGVKLSENDVFFPPKLCKINPGILKKSAEIQKPVGPLVYIHKCQNAHMLLLLNVMKEWSSENQQTYHIALWQ